MPAQESLLVIELLRGAVRGLVKAGLRRGGFYL